MTTRVLFSRRSRWSATAVTVVIGALALASCASPEGEAEPGDDGVSGDLEILVSSASASDAAFEAVNEAFEKEYPDVTVTFSAVDNAAYPATKSSRLTAGNVDIVVLKSFAEVPEFAADSTSEDVLLARAGGLVELTDEAFMSSYTQSVLDSQAVDGKQYAVPTGLSYSTGVYYNKTLFEQHQLSVPTTWQELENVIDSLQADGVTPFGIGGKDTWPAGLAMLGSVAGLYPTAEEKSQLIEELWNSRASLTDELPLEVLARTQKIFDNAQPNFSGAGYDEIPAGFASGAYAMTVDGTWNQPTIAVAVGDAFEFGYFPLPAGDDAAANSFLNGKIELQLGLATNAPNPSAALAWLEFFSSTDVYTTFVEKSGFSPAQPNIVVTDFLTSIEDYTSTFQPAWDTLWIANNKAGQDAVYPFNYPALAPLGSSSVEQAAQSAQNAWQAAF